jgi:hypothetical protein
VSFGLLAVGVGDASAANQGINQTVCLSFGMILGLALLPPEMIIEAVEKRLLNRNKE